MGRPLHMDSAAEREATDVGKKFMGSQDVVGDMSRTYGVDLSSVRIHTDDAAAGKTAERGVDAFSTGKDVFFGKGMFDRSDPASRGLLAHELSHSIQQGVGGFDAMEEAAPMGAEQGGLISWFKDYFRRRRENKRLDAEDRKFAAWDAQGQEHIDAIMSGNMAVNAVPPESEGFDANFTELSARAQELGWRNYKGVELDEGLTENFFREISGTSAGGARGEDGQVRGHVSTSLRSQEDMMAAFQNHDEATTLRVMQPFFDLDVNGFAQQFPFHRMSEEERRIAFTQADAILQPLVGLKQWGEKYGVTTLSEANQQRLDDQINRFEVLTKWVYNMRVPTQSSFAQGYEMNITNVEDVVRGSHHQGEMTQRLTQFENQQAARGSLIPEADFNSVMGRYFSGGRVNENNIHRISNTMPGLKYNPETHMVTSPVPLQELQALAAGDQATLQRYADALRGMDWRTETGEVRRAAEYDATTEEFMDGFEREGQYFGDLSNKATLMELFGQGYMGSQKDGADLGDRVTMAKNTYKMMSDRARNMNRAQSMQFDTQYEGMQKRTWIKRLLNRKRK